MSASGEYLDSALLDRAVDALLSRNGIIALALTDAAVRVPLPRSATRPGHRPVRTRRGDSDREVSSQTSDPLREHLKVPRS
jgi:hypothetical protein